MVTRLDTDFWISCLEKSQKEARKWYMGDVRTASELHVGRRIYHYADSSVCEEL
jgi:hypothetical protein